jgi:CoA:oxalate CoA-transferase
VEVSLFGTQLALQSQELLYALRYGKERKRDFRASPTAGHFECADGRWIMIVGIDQKFWPRIADAIERPELANDPRFIKGGYRFANREALEREIEAAVRTRDSAYWLSRLAERDVPVSLVQGYRDMIDDEQAAANGYVAEYNHPRWGPGKVVGPHVQLSETPAALGLPAPLLGEHTAEVLRDAGYSDARISELASAGVIRIAE